MEHSISLGTKMSDIISYLEQLNMIDSDNITLLQSFPVYDVIRNLL